MVQNTEVPPALLGPRFDHGQPQTWFFMDGNHGLFDDCLTMVDHEG